jgi:hypothetical protein
MILAVGSKRSWTIDTTPFDVLETRISVIGRWRSQRLSTSGVLKCRKMKSRKALYEQALGHGYGHIEEGASIENLRFKVSEITTWTGETLGHRKDEMMKYKIKASL